MASKVGEKRPPSPLPPSDSDGEPALKRVRTERQMEGIILPKLPAEILLTIFSRLPTKALANVCLVSQDWRNVGKTDTLWKALYLADMEPRNPLPAETDYFEAYHTKVSAPRLLAKNLARGNYHRDSLSFAAKPCLSIDYHEGVIAILTQDSSFPTRKVFEYRDATTKQLLFERDAPFSYEDAFKYACGDGKIFYVDPKHSSQIVARDVKSGVILGSIQEETGCIQNLAFAKDRLISFHLCLSGKKAFFIWDATTLQQVTHFPSVSNPWDNQGDFFSYCKIDGDKLTTANSYAVSIWNVKTGGCLRDLVPDGFVKQRGQLTATTCFNDMLFSYSYHTNSIEVWNYRNKLRLPDIKQVSPFRDCVDNDSRNEKIKLRAAPGKLIVVIDEVLKVYNLNCSQDHEPLLFTHTAKEEGRRIDLLHADEKMLLLVDEEDFVRALNIDTGEILYQIPIRGRVGDVLYSEGNILYYNANTSSVEIIDFSPKKRPLPELPSELYVSIFSMLPVSQLIKAAQVSRQWKSYADTEALWKSLYHTDWVVRGHASVAADFRQAYVRNANLSHHLTNGIYRRLLLKREKGVENCKLVFADGKTVAVNNEEEEENLFQKDIPLPAELFQENYNAMLSASDKSHIHSSAYEIYQRNDRDQEKEQVVFCKFDYRDGKVFSVSSHPFNEKRDAFTLHSFLPLGGAECHDSRFNLWVQRQVNSNVHHFVKGTVEQFYEHWDISTCERQFACKYVGQSYSHHFAFGGDNVFFLRATHVRQIDVVDFKTGALVRTLKEPADVKELLFEKGKLIAISFPNDSYHQMSSNFTIWDLDKPEPLLRFPSESSPDDLQGILTDARCVDGKLMTFYRLPDESKAVRIWDLNSGTCLGTLKNSSLGSLDVPSCTCNGEKFYYYNNITNSIIGWDFQKNTQDIQIPKVFSCAASMNDLVSLRYVDQKLIAILDEMLVIFHAETGECLCSWDLCDGERVTELSLLHADKDLLIVWNRSAGFIVFLSTQTSEQLHEIKIPISTDWVLYRDGNILFINRETNAIEILNFNQTVLKSTET